MTHPLEPRLAAYITSQLPLASDVMVEGLERIFGGASRETYRFRLSYAQGGRNQTRKLILRRDPPASLIDTERRIEFATYRAFHGSAVPVPEMLWLEEGCEALGHPFFIAEELSGFQAAPALLFGGGYDAVLPRLAQRKWTILGEIARADPGALGLTSVRPVPALDACWRRELEHWEAIFDAQEDEPQPIARAAIRWLKRHPPPPAQKLSVVHGDYRTGNFLYDEAGDIHGVLDWEMAHLGDPLEDLAWGLNPVWEFGRGLAGGLVPQAQAIDIWRHASGLAADPVALHWWMLFNCVKGQGIWVGSARAFIDGGSREPVLAYAAWWLLNAQDRAILKVMGKL